MDVIFGNSRRKVKAGTVGEVLLALSLGREEALVKVNGTVRPEGWRISSGDSVEAIKVVFGG